jgi:hypothetical protein
VDVVERQREMKRIRGKAATIAACACVAATLIAVPSAQAAVTQTSITTPTDVTYRIYNRDYPNTFAVSGTSNGTKGNHVDINCYAGDKTTTVAANVAVNTNGTFSAPAAADDKANTYRVCQLRAVPAGTTPNPLTPFVGPRLLMGRSQKLRVTSRTNKGKMYDYYLYFQQLDGGNDFASLGQCGIDDGYLLDANDALSTVTWYCNAVLFNRESTPGTRSEIRVDGVNAYTPKGAQTINVAATSGFPALTAYSYHQDPHTGDAVIHETDTIVKCPSASYPPTNVSCPQFVSTGVSDVRTIMQDHDGRVVWITDQFESTDGKKHTLDLLWDNYERFHPNSSGDSTQLEFEFPGQSSYSTHVLNDVVPLPARAGTILVQMHGTADGDTGSGRGAIVYNRPASAATFTTVSTGDEGFNLHQTAKIPANGAVTFRWAYIQDFHAATVASLAQEAAVVVKGCTVPKVIGKSLATAKAALAHAHCSVGRITRARSSKVRTRHVISESPKAGTNIDYQAKVSLVVRR